MGTVYDKLVDQAEAMVNIINKKYVAGNRMAYLALLSGVGSCRIESPSLVFAFPVKHFSVRSSGRTALTLRRV